MSGQPKKNEKTFSQAREERIAAAKQLGAFFELFPDKRQASGDLLKLCSDRDNSVREEAVSSLVIAFPAIPDKELAWKSLVNLTAYPDEGVMRAAVNALINSFPLLPDKNNGWKDLFELINSKSSFEDVSNSILLSLQYIIPEVPDKQQVWEDLLKMTVSSDSYTREKATSSLSIVFPALEDKEKAWNELLELTAESTDLKVREQAARTLGIVFSETPYEMRDEALDGLFELAVSGNREVQKEILMALPFTFSHILDKERVWDEIIRLTEDDSEYLRKQALDTLISIFPEMSDKEKIWYDLMNLVKAKDDYVRSKAATVLGSVFPYLNNKESHWNEVMGFMDDKDFRKMFADNISRAFPYLSKKEEVCSEFVLLAEKKNSAILREIVQNLASTYPESCCKREIHKGIVPEEKGTESIQNKNKQTITPVSESGSNLEDRKEYVENEKIELIFRKDPKVSEKEEITEKLITLGSNPDSERNESSIKTLLTPYTLNSGKAQEIWKELLKKAGDRDATVRKSSAWMLSYVFPLIEDKTEVFFDFMKLMESQDSQVRKKAAELLTDAFLYSGDKQRAWNELLKLESSADREVRKGAILALSSGYSEVPDKTKAWKDLLRLSAHSDTFVQRAATRALGYAFFYMPDKTQAWRDLQMLTENPYVYARRYAFRSLGRASLWRALKAENEATYIFGLKEAVKYFKEATETSGDANIPEFYQPFYEALLYILFSERQGIARTESERYLSKMRMISGIAEQPENKNLPEIFEQLAGLLQAAGNLTPGDLPAQKKLLETSISIFDRFLKFIENKEEAILSRKAAKKEQLQPGKAILERVEKKKSFLRRRP